MSSNVVQKKRLIYNLDEHLWQSIFAKFIAALTCKAKSSAISIIFFFFFFSIATYLDGMVKVVSDVFFLLLVYASQISIELIKMA